MQRQNTKNVYTVGSPDDQPSNYALTINLKVMPFNETSSNVNGNYAWFNDNTFMPYVQYPYFTRGTDFGYTSVAGAFAFRVDNGWTASHIGFRPILLVDQGL